MGELVQVLGFVKVFQHEPAPLDQGRAERQGIFEQPGRGGRGQDLAPVGGGGDAGSLVHGHGQVTAVGASCGHPAVQPHPHSDDGVDGPGVGGQGPLGVDAGRRRPGRVGEHDQATVGPRAGLGPAVGGHRVADDPALVLQQPGEAGPQPLGQAGGAFHVGEKERHVARRQPLGRGGTGGPARHAQGRVLGQDGRFQHPDVLARFQPQFLAQHRSQPLVGAQGVGLAAAAVQGHHELGPAPLPQRLGRHRRLQVPDQPGVLGQGQAGVEEVLLCPPAQLGQAGGLGRPERTVGQLHQGVTPPPPQRRYQQAPCPAGVPGLEGTPGAAHLVLELPHVHLMG